MGRFLSELRRRKVFHTAAVYAGVAAVVWGAANDALPALGFPEGAVTLVVVATLLGFPVAVVLAWFFEVRLEETARLEPGEGLAPQEAGTPVPGPAPPRRHRWWLVAVGAAAVAVLTPLIGLRLTSTGAGFSRDAEPGGIDPSRIVVLPFRVSSSDPDLQALREGMLDLLSPLLSQMPWMVDPGTTMAAWRGVVPSEEEDLSEAASLDLARRLGAGRVLLGSVVGTGDHLVLSGRLLEVPGGEGLGSATAEGSDSALWGLAEELAVQLIGMEAGEEAARLDFLRDPPIQAVREYLEGQRFYRQGSPFVAAEHFARALDMDSAFALAALGFRNAADHLPQRQQRRYVPRASRLVADHLDRLPPRDRIYADFMLRMFEPLNAVERVEDASRLVEALPDKAEAWHHLGSRLFQTWRWVAADDYLDRAEAAWARMRALDPGMRSAYYSVIAEARGDTAGMRRWALDFVAGATPGDESLETRLVMAYRLGDSVQRRWILDAMDTLPSPRLVSMIMGGGGVGPPDVPDADIDRWLEALRTAPVTPDEQFEAVSLRYRVFRSLGRTAEAEAELHRRAELAAELMGLPVLAWLLDPLYWEGDEAEGVAWIDRLREEYGEEGAPIAQPQWQAIVITLWKIWEIRSGNTDEVDWAVARLREAAGDPDPTHNVAALGALLLETMVAHERGEAAGDSLVAELRRVVGQGLHSYGEIANLELARILEDRGEYLAAARAVFRPSTGYGSWPWGDFLSTMVHEAGRLYDAAGDVDQALYFYRWYLLLRKRPDPHLQPEADRIRDRVAKLEARRG